MAVSGLKDWKPWKQKEAITLLKKLEKLLYARCNLHVALGGSVLFTGKSKHDLDVIVYPHNTTHFSIFVEEFEYAVRQLGLIPYMSTKRLHSYWRSKGGTDTKRVEVWEYKGKRVDFILLECPLP